MDKLNNKEEVDFLKGYIQFSPSARVLEAKALWGMAKNMKPCDERAMLCLVAIESFFMQQETLYKFLKATKARVSGKNYLATLQTTAFNPEQDLSKLFSSDDLKVKYPLGLSEDEKNKMKQRVDNIIKTCKDLAEANKVFSGVYYVLKHGFLVYKKGREIMSLMHQEKEKIFVEYLQKQGVKGERDSLYKNDFSYIIDLNERIACAIQDVIAVRLLQLGVTKLWRFL